MSEVGMQGDNRSITIEKDAISSAIISGSGNKVVIYLYQLERQIEPEPAYQPGEIGSNPYKGLLAFHEEDSDHYFGREEQIEKLWNLFRTLHENITQPEPPLRLLTILGPSGCGKSSLARAGLIPELARRPLPGKSQARVAVLVPGTHPVEALATVLARVATNDQTPVAKTMEFERVLKEAIHTKNTIIYDGLRRIANVLPEIAVSPLVVLVDQFEEVYSLCADTTERQIFIENLIHAAGDRAGGVSVIITLRSDFLGETQRHPALNQVIAKQSLFVPAMSEEELRRAITKPAELAGHPLDEAVVTLLLQDTQGRGGALPLLQFALTRIWEGLKKGVEPIKTLEDIGDVGGALADEAQRIYQSLNDEEKQIARRVFLGLVQLEEGGSYTRRRASINSLVSYKDEPEYVKRVIERFANPGVRLVTLSSEQGTETAEVTHEALFVNWGQMQAWLDNSRSDIRFQHYLDETVRRWNENGRPDGSLWRSPDLDLLGKYYERASDNMTPLQVEFFHASIASVKKQEGIFGNIRNIWKRFTGGNRQPENEPKPATVETKAPEEAISVSPNQQQNLGVVKTYAWYPCLETPTKYLSVGQNSTLTLNLTPDSQPNTEPLRVPVNTLEITVYIEAPGFLLQGEHTRTLPVKDGELMERSLTLHLTPLTSGDRIISLSVYPGGRLPNLSPVKLQKALRVNRPRVLPNIPELIDRRAIPAPEPDIILHITLEEVLNPKKSTGLQRIGLYLTCAALSCDRQPLDFLEFTADDLEGLRQFAVQAAAVANGSPVDVLRSLQRIGVTLFDQLMPPDSQLREYYSELFDLANISPSPLSWLIVSEAQAVLPWELICAYYYNPETEKNWYDEFLAQKFIVAHWVGYQGIKLANEAPLLKLGLTHYNQHPQQLSRWQKVLGSETQAESTQQSGLVALMQPSSLCYGLHILRYTDIEQTGQITAYQANSQPTSGKTLDRAEELLYNQRLDFTLRRPVVGLSLVDGQPPNRGMGMVARDNQLEADWMLPLMHAGASALVGARWSVLPESDRFFYRIFYNLIRTGTELGEAVWQARKQVKYAFPHRSDWLAYTYFGHPQCQPYLVRSSQGFTFFEAINPPENDNFLAGESYDFRASYRTEAPVWYDGRLTVQQMSSETEDLSVMMVHLTGEIPPETYPLQPVISQESYQNIITITMPSQKTILPLLIRFQKNNEELNTLFLNLNVVDRGQP